MTQLDQISSDMTDAEAAYRFGEQAGIDRLIVTAAAMGQTVDPDAIQKIKHAASQTFPLTAADLMPELQGPALGKAMKAAEKRWINSGFTLAKAELIG
jgi:poly(A) polymerase